MYKGSRSEKIYNTLLNLYPRNYLKEYREEMIFFFRDMQEDRKINNQSWGIFWLVILKDLFLTVPRSYLYILKFNYIKHYFLQTDKGRIALAGIILLTPSVFLIVFATMAQYLVPTLFVQLRESVIYNSILLGLLIKWLPMITVGVEGTGLIYVDFIKTKEKVFSIKFLKSNAVLLGILIVAASILALLYFHDSVHCFLNWNILTTNLLGCIRQS